MQHLDEGTIHAWLDGAFDADENSRIERHVADCAACSAAVADARGLIAGASRIVSSLDVVRGGVIPKTAAPAAPRSAWRAMRVTPFRAAMAASLLVGAATVFSIHGDKVTIPAMAAIDTARPAATDAPAAVAPARTTNQPAPATIADKKTVAPANTRQAEKTPIPPQNAAPALADARERDAVSSAKAMTAGRMAPASIVADSASRVAEAPRREADAPARPAVAAASDATRSRDSTRRVDAIGAVSAAPAVTKALGGRGAAGGGAPVQRLVEAVTPMSGFAANAVEGCYELKADSTLVQARGRALPERFSLAHTAGDSPRNVVRAVSAEGRVLEEITDAEWSGVAGAAVRVFWGPRDDPTTRILIVRFTATAIVGQLSTRDGAPMTIELVRTTCRP